MGFIETAGELPRGTIVLGKYRVDGVLGSGGMGIVYAAHHTFMDQRVALKLLVPEALTGPDAITRFITEARHAAKIPGENACRILDVGLLETGLPYIAMEYLEGSSLDVIAAKQAAIPMRDAARWVLEALIAVAHAHARGIVHRDLKPSNLFLATRDDGSRVVKVLDFGISRSVDSAKHKLTSTRSMLGSPGYISPEHIRNSKVADPRSDLWSLGVVLYELVSGTSPFDADSVVGTVAAILETDPPPLTSPREALPPEFCAVVHRCLAKAREERFQDVVELARALAPFAGHEGPAMAERARRALTSGGSPLARPDLGEATVVRPYVPSGPPPPDGGHVVPTGSSPSLAPGSPSPSGAPASMAPPGRLSTGRLWTTASSANPVHRRSRSWAGALGALLAATAVGVAIGHSTRSDPAPAALAGSALPLASAAARGPAADDITVESPPLAPPMTTQAPALPPAVPIASATPPATPDSARPAARRPPRPAAAQRPVGKSPSPLATSRD